MSRADLEAVLTEAAAREASLRSDIAEAVDHAEWQHKHILELEAEAKQQQQACFAAACTQPAALGSVMPFMTEPSSACTLPHSHSS